MDCGRVRTKGPLQPYRQEIMACAYLTYILKVCTSDFLSSIIGTGRRKREIIKSCL